MKLAIVTVAIGDNYAALAKMTHPTLRAYAERIGADFIVIDRTKIAETSPHYEKFQIYDLLNVYHRIIYLDTDLIVREDCPNLFDIVEPRSLGMFDEGAIMDRTQAMAQACADYQTEIKNWDGRYFNTGVMVISRTHKEIFKKPAKEIWNFYEQSYINVKAFEKGAKIHNLDYRFNRMSCMDKVTGEHRLASYIVHYAGVLGGLSALIPADLQAWSSGAHKSLKRHVLIEVGSNRLGDNVAVEPVVRHMIESRPDASFAIAATHPAVFGHLREIGVAVSGFDDIQYKPDTPYLSVTTDKPREHPLKRALSADRMHMTDYASIVAMKRTLPYAKKQIKLPVTQKGIGEVLEVVGASLADHVLVHPGKAWPSKTFPEAYWQDVIKNLVEMKLKVAVIGADSALTGVLGMELPEGVVDLRNLLSEEGLFAAVSMSPVLITNDSAPLHIAGAFDNEVVLIPTCKDPDLILPWRKGSQYYKVTILTGNSKMWEQEKLDLTGLEPWDMESVPGNITDYLPEPRRVALAATSLTPTS
jgi:hypothetical protein